jgi:hypothetical protein
MYNCLFYGYIYIITYYINACVLLLIFLCVVSLPVEFRLCFLVGGMLLICRKWKVLGEGGAWRIMVQ